MVIALDIIFFQMFFIDHNKRLTTFLDPRLPTDVPPINTDFLHSNLFTGRNRGVRVVDDSPRNHSSVSFTITYMYIYSQFLNDSS